MPARTLLALLLLGCREGALDAPSEAPRPPIKEASALPPPANAAAPEKAAPTVPPVLVRSPGDLAAHGTMSVTGLRAVEGGAEVSVTFENRGESALRIEGIDILVLDADGFARHPDRYSAKLAVAARGKEQLVLNFATPPERIKTVRVWSVDLPPPPTSVGP